MKVQVLVFRTSISEHDEVHRLTPVLNGLLHPDEKWNFDLEDRENILRVEAISVGASAIIQNLQREGFFCEELED